jgi:hypothetical protein
MKRPRWKERNISVIQLPQEEIASGICAESERK